MEKTDKSAEEILNENASVPKPQIEGTLKAMHEYAAQQLSEYKERLRELLVDRINKSEQERRQCTPGSDAYTLMLGHKYEATKLLELIDKLQSTSSEQSGNSSDNSNNL